MATVRQTSTEDYVQQIATYKGVIGDPLQSVPHPKYPLRGYPYWVWFGMGLGVASSWSVLPTIHGPWYTPSYYPYRGTNIVGVGWIRYTRYTMAHLTGYRYSYGG